MTQEKKLYDIFMGSPGKLYPTALKSQNTPITEPVITHKLIISGKVIDVCEQLKIMCKQFPNATIRQVCEAYGVKELILQ